MKQERGKLDKMTAEYKIPMTENNRKLQEVLNYFSDRAERCPCTRLICNGGDCIEGYSLGVILNPKDTQNFYRGPRGIKVDLDINYDHVLGHGQPQYFMRRAFALDKPGFLQDALARADLEASLDILCEAKRGTDLYVAQYRFVGDRVSAKEDMSKDSENTKILRSIIPARFWDKEAAVQVGDSAVRAVDLAYDLWEWDNEM